MDDILRGFLLMAIGLLILIFSHQIGKKYMGLTRVLIKFKVDTLNRYYFKECFVYFGFCLVVVGALIIINSSI